MVAVWHSQSTTRRCCVLSSDQTVHISGTHRNHKIDGLEIGITIRNRGDAAVAIHVDKRSAAPATWAEISAS